MPACPNPISRAAIWRRNVTPEMFQALADQGFDFIRLPTDAIKPWMAALLELGSGFNPEFTGRENVYLNATILGLTRREIDERQREETGQRGEDEDQQPVDDDGDGGRRNASEAGRLHRPALLEMDAQSLSYRYRVLRCQHHTAPPACHTSARRHPDCHHVYKK